MRQVDPIPCHRHLKTTPATVCHHRSDLGRISHFHRLPPPHRIRPRITPSPKRADSHTHHQRQPSDEIHHPPLHRITPHSGHRSSLPRKSYPHPRHNPR